MIGQLKGEIDARNMISEENLQPENPAAPSMVHSKI
jgi:hypothetical protein